jgi:uncharacterized membrane protein
MRRVAYCVAIVWCVGGGPVFAETLAADGSVPIASSNVVSPPAVAGESPPDHADATNQEGVAAWVISQGKTVTYRIAASVDALIVGYLYTGSLLGGGGIALLNAVVSSALYDVHETLWNDYGPDPQSDPAGIALVKTVSYRIVSIANVLVTGLYFTGDIWTSSGLALGNAVIDSTIYFFHELAWSRWGPPIKKDGTADATAVPPA